MSPFLALRRLFSWIALAAILGLALVPTLSQALAKDGGSWMQICSAQGSKLVAVADLAPADPGAPSTLQLEHCPFCVLHAPLLPTQPLRFSFTLPEVAPARYPSLFFSAPRPLFAWSSAHPRAPPVLS
ncbi:DUF2946 domain-containing protein [Janthinobacterium fluminis]|uniref:DUF2946 domain-containing protein n=1 Tax=Janthinobacterium fluminis TaxID=2987524 RepID=A0ABT5K578_9BURK|nr:DUF2946 domain-containing protein [Janthinobacterium fluminis]MDC8760163.1 DUF2946 domain-containing protein [Janthinobacterium fluminis]